MTLTLIMLYAKCFAAVWIGFIIHTLSKYTTNRDLAIKANSLYPFGQFLKDAWPSHTINMLCVCLWMIAFGEFLKAYPDFPWYMWIIISAIVGWGNSSIVLKLFGSGTGKILKIIDEKTNIADGVTK